jgi:hypothetical protein
MKKRNENNFVMSWANDNSKKQLAAAACNQTHLGYRASPVPFKEKETVWWRPSRRKRGRRGSFHTKTQLTR